MPYSQLFSLIPFALEFAGNSTVFQCGSEVNTEYLWASLVARLVKNPPVLKTPIRFLGWKIPGGDRLL